MTAPYFEPGAPSAFWDFRPMLKALGPAKLRLLPSRWATLKTSWAEGPLPADDLRRVVVELDTAHQLAAVLDRPCFYEFIRNGYPTHISARLLEDWARSTRLGLSWVHKFVSVLEDLDDSARAGHVECPGCMGTAEECCDYCEGLGEREGRPVDCPQCYGAGSLPCVYIAPQEHDEVPF